ncbi:hypothetical protein [Planotetraspora sp. GP83]|uniref:hypothetical protein n=1 Tax=Planotetraspora sp. GP83 TaxID=3156264 RepID=UPI0035176CA0
MAQANPPGGVGLAAGAVQDDVLDPTPVPEPFGPSRVYGGLILVERPELTVQTAGKARPKRRPKERRSDGDGVGLTCGLEWQGTWLWELCQERGGQV